MLRGEFRSVGHPRSVLYEKESPPLWSSQEDYRIQRESRASRHDSHHEEQSMVGPQCSSIVDTGLSGFLQNPSDPTANWGGWTSGKGPSMFISMLHF